MPDKKNFQKRSKFYWFLDIQYKRWLMKYMMLSKREGQLRHTAPNFIEERDVKACDEIYVSDFTAPIIRVMMRRKNRLTS
ncbi:unnamed protein product [Rhizophagus irregularis]|nr:unnamed protein product [Rhizophagus irregularis]